MEVGKISIRFETITKEMQDSERNSAYKYFTIDQEIMTPKEKGKRAFCKQRRSGKVSMKHFVTDFYRKYGRLMSRLSRE